MVVSAPDFPDPESRENSRRLVYLVPRKFPFIFQVCPDQLENGLDPKLLHVAFQKLNSLKRLLVSKSFIPKKIIYSNMDKLCLGREVRTGCSLSLSIFEPLSGAVKFSRPTMPFDLFELHSQKVAVVDLEAQEDCQLHALLDSRCNVLEVGVNIGKYARKQRFVVFLLNSWKVKSTELYYCLLKLNSQMLLKIYFEPNELELVQPAEGGESLAQIRSFRITRVQVEIGKAAEGLSGLPKGSFLTSISRARVNCDEANYRMNLLVPHKDQQLLVCDQKMISALYSCTPHKREHSNFFRESLQFRPDVYVQTPTDHITVLKDHFLKCKASTNLGASKSHNPETCLPISQGIEQKGALAPRPQAKQCLTSGQSKVTDFGVSWRLPTNTGSDYPRTRAAGNYQLSEFGKASSHRSSVAGPNPSESQTFEGRASTAVRTPKPATAHATNRKSHLLPDQNMPHLPQPSTHFSASRPTESEALGPQVQSKRKNSLRVFEEKDASVNPQLSHQRFSRRALDE